MQALQRMTGSGVGSRQNVLALALAVGSVPFLLRILRTAWRGSTAKEELCRKILGDGAPSAALPPQAGGICMLYDAGKFAEGMSVERIAQCMAEGMAGDPAHDPEWSINWMLGPSLKDRSDPTGHRKDIVSFFMTFVLHSSVLLPSEGCVLASRDAGAEISAVNVVRVFRNGYRKSWGEWTWELRVCWGCFFAGTLPKVYTDSAHKQLSRYIEARTRYATEVLMHQMHAKHAAGPHYYVAIMSTLPSKQGQGHCGKLMRAVSKAADIDGLPCYLECSGQRNTNIYKRFGYKVVDQHTLSVENDEPGSAQYDEWYAMVRPPQGQPVTQE